MSILIYTEATEGKFKKTAFELASYAKKIAGETGDTVTALTINVADTQELGNYGVDKILTVNSDKLGKFNAKAYADVISQAAKKEDAKIVLFSATTDSLYAAPLVAVELEAGYASNVVALPESTSPFRVKRNAFSNKAFNITEINTDVKVLAISKNSFGLAELSSSPDAEEFSPSLNDNDFSTKVESVEKVTGQVTIADAEVVVSGGRGLKGPETGI